MSNVFTKNSTMFHVNDNSVPLLLFIRLAGEGDGTDTETSPFNDVDITNFSTKSAADYSLQRSASGGFVYTVFGNSSVMITLDGIQVAPESPTSKGDIEAWYTLHNIGASDRKLINITAMYTKPRELKNGSKTVTSHDQYPVGTTEYQGYLVGFTKKPMGHDKIAGYGFSMTLVCTIKPKNR